MVEVRGTCVEVLTHFLSDTPVGASNVPELSQTHLKQIADDFLGSLQSISLERKQELKVETGSLGVPQEVDELTHKVAKK